MTIESAIENARSLIDELRELGPMIVTSEDIEALEGVQSKLERAIVAESIIDQVWESYHE